MIKCEKCNKEFGTEEALNQHNRSKHYELYQEPRIGLSDKQKKKQKKKIRNWSITLAVLLLIIVGISYLASNSKTLPPISDQGHIEVSPSSHILREPMDIKIQKHMLEHADGKGPPGIIINYNCIDYACEPDLIEKLEAFAEKYPANVYVAPFKNMDAKIVLTRLNKIEILESFDENKIEAFINNRL
ncbi:hypothetical protein HYV89_01580 [Candidatus Woesearchaeota archaeon]|nr:hypothetical protein [Candidatus Woesearchaeota archaeon]